MFLYASVLPSSSARLERQIRFVLGYLLVTTAISSPTPSAIAPTVTHARMPATKGMRQLMAGVNEGLLLMYLLHTRTPWNSSDWYPASAAPRATSSSRATKELRREVKRDDGFLAVTVNLELGG